MTLSTLPRRSPPIRRGHTVPNHGRKRRHPGTRVGQVSARASRISAPPQAAVSARASRPSGVLQTRLALPPAHHPRPALFALSCFLVSLVPFPQPPSAKRIPAVPGVSTFLGSCRAQKHPRGSPCFPDGIPGAPLWHSGRQRGISPAGPGSTARCMGRTRKACAIPSTGSCPASVSAHSSHPANAAHADPAVPRNRRRSGECRTHAARVAFMCSSSPQEAASGPAPIPRCTGTPGQRSTSQPGSPWYTRNR